MSKSKIFPPFKPSLKSPDKNFIYFTNSFFVISGLLVAVYFITHSAQTNGIPGLPFDDSFIHLTFAKNLSEYFSFSYYRDEIVTSGSSSPLFVFILAAGYSVIKNEFLLSYVTGILFFIISIYFFLKFCLNEFSFNPYHAIISVLIFTFDKWIAYFSVSGMETVLFIMVLILSANFYRSSNAIPLSIVLGVLIWIRPEGLIFIAALGIDYLLSIIFKKKNSYNKELKKFTLRQIIFITAVISIFTILYFSMNLYLSGSIFPNSFYAKMSFYSPQYMSREYFIITDVWKYFTNGSYSVLFTGFAISFLITLHNIFKREYSHNFLYMFFFLSFILVYWYKMPYSGLNGRYLVPLIPFYIFISVSGIVNVFSLAERYTKNRILINCSAYFLILITFYLNGNDLKTSVKLYSEDCNHLERTRITTAKWLLNNTAPCDKIATHEIGAVGFYSNRKIIDIAGIISPKLIEKLPDKNYINILQEYLKSENVRYFVTLDNWCKVVNVIPVFSCIINDSNPEVLETYKYSPDAFHILGKEVNKLLFIADYNFKKNNTKEALRLLHRAIEKDSVSSLSYYRMAEVYQKLGDIHNYNIYLEKAVSIFPDYHKAKMKFVNMDKSGK